MPLAPVDYTGPRRVSINSFGYGGTNAHAVLEAYEEEDYLSTPDSGVSSGHGSTHLDAPKPVPIVISAHSDKSLGKLVSNIKDWLTSDTGHQTPFNSLAYTLNVRRSKLPWRCNIVASSTDEVVRALEDPRLRKVKAARGTNVGFVFTGQGAQWFAMGRELLASSRAFAGSIAACNEALEGFGCEWNLAEELSRPKESSRLGESRWAQPATTAIQVALVDLLRECGVTPETVHGHSSGEIAAAYAAGALSRDGAMLVAYHRGVCSSIAKGLNATQGAMMAVGEGEDAVSQRIQDLKSGRVVVACVNSPESTTISGDLAAIEELETALNTASVFNRRLRVDSAYHSHHMQAVAEAYLTSLSELDHNAPQEDVAFYSSVTGERKLSDFGPSYWVSNLVSQVKFSAASELVAKHLDAMPGANVLAEIGPHSALAGPLRQSLASISGDAAFEYTYVPTLVRNENALATTSALLGRAFQLGVKVQLDFVMNDWTRTNAGPHRVLNHLPSYPWDHDTKYWHESRLSKGHRQRPFPKHDLVGLLDVSSSNTHEPRWTYHISLKALPWLQDHVVEGFVIFPGAGYVTMVTEAMKQLLWLRKTPGRVTHFNMRDVAFKESVVINGSEDSATYQGSDSDEVELQLTLSPARQHNGSPWECFRVLSHDSKKNTWTEHCTGFVAVETEAAADEVEGTREQHLSTEAATELLQSIKDRSSIKVEPAEVYSDLAASGNAFGPSFQGLKEIRVGECCGIGKVVIHDIAKGMPGEYMQPHLIHPTTFDAVNQLQAAVFRRECSIAPVMPVVLGQLSISVDIDAKPGAEMLVALDLFPEGPRGALGNSVAYAKQADGSFSPVLTVSGVRLQVVGEADLGSKAARQKDNYSVEWQPDVSYLTQGQFVDRVSECNFFDVGYGMLSKLVAEEQLRLNDQVATILIRRAVKQLAEAGVSEACNPHLSKLLEWMQEWSKSSIAGKLLQDIDTADEDRLIDQARGDNIFGFTISRLGPRFVDIFTGKADPLELLVEDDLLGRLYSEYTLFSSHYAQLAEYIATVVHKHPDLKVLEVGAGTGSATMPLLERIDRGGRLPLSAYTYTDISSGFFERARAKFGQWSGQMDFKTLDISRDPADQGFAGGEYDLILASIVLHATPVMDETMENVRKLLKPGGRLVLMELTGLAAANNAIFGTLEGWWMSEDGRKDGPLLTVQEWDGLFKRHGFSGTDLAVPAHLGQASDLSSMIVTTAVGPEPATVDGFEVVQRPASETTSKAVIRLGYSKSSQQTSLGSSICQSLRDLGVSCSQQAWSSSPATDPDALEIVVDSAEHPLLLEPEHEIFEQTKELLLQGRNVLWVSFQESTSPDAAALKHMVNGVARVVRRENPGLRLVTIDVQDGLGEQPSQTPLNGVAKTVAAIARSSFWPASEDERAEEWEYALRGGKVTIPRVVPDQQFAAYADSRNDQDDTLVEQRYLDQSRPLKLDVKVPGLLNTLRFVDNPRVAQQPLGADEIEVQARAYGLNFKDVFIALGQMRPGVHMTGEVAGVVTAVGSDAQSLWKKGDRVVGLMVDPFGSLVRVKANAATAIPESISFADAASIPVIYYTAWYCLTQIARLERGQTVLIHAASGGVGQAAIQIAHMIGAEVFATVGSVSKSKLVQDKYGVNPDHIFSSHARTFKKGIMRLTGAKGVDVVLNSLSGQYLMDSWDCVAPFGTFLEIGKTDIYEGSQLNMANFEKQATFAAVDTSHMYRLRPEFVRKGLDEILNIIDRGDLKPVHPVTTYPMSQIEDAFRLIAARKHVGKLVLVADENTMVQAPRPKSEPLKLRGDGTYVIGGGLGDLGMRMSHLLAERGAGHIVTLSRRNVDAAEQASLKQGISKLGAQLHIVRCDIGDEGSVRSAAKEMAELNLPPVRGIIQSALVLRDHPLEYMPLDDWTTAMKPKVQGTLNMHSVFCNPKDTDFFVMLSSIASIVGSPSQSNYSAGNAFQDAFAHAWHGQGGITRYTTINVGAVEGSEQIKRALELNSDMARMVGSVSFDEVFATLEYAMAPKQDNEPAKPPQCIMTFDRDSMETAMGETALSDHLFDHVPSQRKLEHSLGGGSGGSANANQRASPAQAVERAGTIEEAEEIVSHAVAAKFTAFIGDEVPDDQPVASLGLDSLVSIEIKNWVKHTFKAPLQTSELSNASSIKSLAKLIVSRMDLKGKSGGGQDQQQPVAKETKPDTASELPPKSESKPNHHNKIPGATDAQKSDATIPQGLSCCKHSTEILAQKLPDLDNALDHFLETSGHLYSEDQLAIIQQGISVLRPADSPIRRALREWTAANPSPDGLINGWYNDTMTDARWMSNRVPLAPYQLNMATHRDSKIPQSQAERAALVASAAFEFKLDADSEGEDGAVVIEPVWIAGRPACTSRQVNLFNTVREPGVGKDRLVTYPGNDHIAVLRKGRVFKVTLRGEDGSAIPVERLKVTFEVILERVGRDEGVWNGILTSDGRDAWAQTRARLAASSTANAEYLRVIESALFVLSLDDGCPETSEERARDGYVGDGANRWFDKTLQFFVSGNGRSGLITEHGAYDGINPARLSERIAKAIDDYSGGDAATHGLVNDNKPAISNIDLEEVVLETTGEDKTHIELLKGRFLENTSRGAYAVENLTEFGIDFLLQANMPVKQIVDLTFQLGVHLLVGRNLPTWESVSVAHFHKGRTEVIQRAPPAVAAFCAAAAESSSQSPPPASGSNNHELMALLQTATKQMHADVQGALGGQRSHVRYLELLNWLWPSDATVPKPQLLSAELFNGSPYIHAQSNALETEMVIDDFVKFFHGNPDGFWSIMTPRKDS